MSSFIIIAMFIAGGLALAKWLHARDVDRDTPLCWKCSGRAQWQGDPQSDLGFRSWWCS
ncbi:MAG: hypothetical protein U5J82_03995 [Desulfobacterales bacterium]|nr:hypothetical protein [Desulfobacterales bacterium]